jgi:hypothetical protein
MKGEAVRNRNNNIEHGTLNIELRSEEGRTGEHELLSELRSSMFIVPCSMLLFALPYSTPPP